MYRAMIILSFVFGMGYATFDLKKRDVPRNIRFYLLMMETSFVLYLGFMATFIQSRGKLLGLNGSGGAVGLLLGVLVFSRITPQYKKEIMNAYIIVLPLMYGIGKIGCAFAGCCAGRSYNGLFSIHTEAEDLFPVQALEAIVFILTFAMSVYFKEKRSFDPLVAALIYSVLKVLLDFFRDTHPERFITTNQIMCTIIATALGIGIIIRKSRREKIVID